jgi:prophage maintenance system killer protein
LDGNKRTAFIITEDFLNSVGLTISDSKGVAVKLIEIASGLAENSSPANREKLEAEFEAFLRKSVAPYVEPEIETN